MLQSKNFRAVSLEKLQEIFEEETGHKGYKNIESESEYAHIPDELSPPLRCLSFALKIVYFPSMFLIP
jgi:hypothetical protein